MEKDIKKLEDKINELEKIVKNRRKEYLQYYSDVFSKAFELSTQCSNMADRFFQASERYENLFMISAIVMGTNIIMTLILGYKVFFQG